MVCLSAAFSALCIFPLCCFSCLSSPTAVLIYRENTGTREASFRRGLELLALRSILMNQPLNKVFLDRDTCKKRERLYARKGLTWMNCQLAGTDGAAATFACLLVIMYGASVVLALRSCREQKHYKDSREQHRNHSEAPEYLWSGTL